MYLDDEEHNGVLGVKHSGIVPLEHPSLLCNANHDGGCFGLSLEGLKSRRD